MRSPGTQIAFVRVVSPVSPSLLVQYNINHPYFHACPSNCLHSVQVEHSPLLSPILSVILQILYFIYRKYSVGMAANGEGHQGVMTTVYQELLDLFYFVTHEAVLLKVDC